MTIENMTADKWSCSVGQFKENGTNVDYLMKSIYSDAGDFN